MMIHINHLKQQVKTMFILYIVKQEAQGIYMLLLALQEGHIYLVRIICQHHVFYSYVF